MSWADSMFRAIALGSIAVNLLQWLRGERRRRKRPPYRLDQDACSRFPDWRVHTPQWTRREGR